MKQTDLKYLNLNRRWRSTKIANRRRFCGTLYIHPYNNRAELALAMAHFTHCDLCIMSTLFHNISNVAFLHLLFGKTMLIMFNRYHKM